MNINWASRENHILMNPRMDPADSTKIFEALSAVPVEGHIWISTSGTTSTAKWAALSKQAMLIAAQAANEHLNVTSRDVWLNPLPHFHVGGLGIIARCYQNGAKWFPYLTKWDPCTFLESLKKHSITHTSLVPAQVHDVVQRNLQSPQSLKAVVVGGGKLSDDLYQKARSFGWPLLPSYGMTECCSQVATATASEAPRMKVLPHMKVKMTDVGLIAIQSRSLLTGYAYVEEGNLRWEDPKVDGWFVTKDRGKIDGNFLEMLGRSDDIVKIGGENVDFAYLESILDRFKGRTEAALIPFDDPRLGMAVHLCVAGDGNSESLVAAFNQAVMPFEKIRKVHYVKELPKTDLGKIKKKELVESLRG